MAKQKNSWGLHLFRAVQTFKFQGPLAYVRKLQQTGDQFGALLASQDRWKEFEVGKDAILRLEQESEQVDYGYHGCDKGFVLEGIFE